MKSIRTAFALIAIVLLAQAVPLLAAPADLDTTFSGTGKVTTAIGSGEDTALNVAVQFDGKILVAGKTHNGSNYDFALVRYNANGSLDTTFNLTGRVTTAIGSGDDVAKRVAVQSDGKILLAGDYYDGSNYHLAVVRYNSDGSLDTTFNDTGKATTSISTTNDSCYGLALQGNGKIVVAGSAVIAGSVDFAVVRYNADGSLDTTFNGTGKVTTPVGSSSDYATDVVLQSDGKIVLTGVAFNGSNDDIALARYNANGSLDTTFNGTGKVITTLGASTHEEGECVAMQNDGKILVGGWYYGAGNNDFALVRYNANGSLDTTFNGTGKVTTAVGTGNDYCQGLAVQTDGKILLAGYAAVSGSSDVAVVRYNTDGSLEIGRASCRERV